MAFVAQYGLSSALDVGNKVGKFIDIDPANIIKAMKIIQDSAS